VFRGGRSKRGRFAAYTEDLEFRGGRSKRGRFAAYTEDLEFRGGRSHFFPDSSGSRVFRGVETTTHVLQ
jgi:hypothetical protein